MLDIGLVLANAGVPAGSTTTSELLDIAAIADESTVLDTVWVGDSLLTVPRVEAITLLAACASRTSRVRLGVGCMASLGLRDPLLLAAQWASLDAISNGRCLLVACGGPLKGAKAERELATYDLTYGQKITRLDQAIAALRAAGRGESMPLPNGNVDLGLRFSTGQPEIWYVANPPNTANEAAVRNALTKVATVADGWMTFGTSVDVLRQRVTILRDLVAAAEHPRAEQFPVNVYVDVNLAADDAAALADAAATNAKEGRAVTDPEVLRRSAAIGSTQHCLDYVGTLIDAGATSVALRPVTGNVMEQVHRIVGDLGPALRSR